MGLSARAVSDWSLRSRGSRWEAAAFLSHLQTKSMSARSFVQDSGARSWAPWNLRFPTLADSRIPLVSGQVGDYWASSAKVERLPRRGSQNRDRLGRTSCVPRGVLIKII